MKDTGANGGRVARTHYTVRTLSFAYSFLVIGVALGDRGAGIIAWSLLALQFLVYPQLAYLHTVSSQDSKRAEIINLHVDALTLGVWIAALGFPTWIAYAALFSTILNLSIMRGASGAASAAVCFAAGALAWVAPMGFKYHPATSDIVSALCFFGSLAYSAGVGFVVRNQNLRLRAAREDLREGEQRYRLITEHAADLVAMVDADARWRYVSPSYSRILEAEDLAIGADAFRKLHDDDQMKVRGALQALIKSGMTGKIRMRLHTRYGEVRRFECQVHVVRAEDGSISGAVMASRDITELSDREEQLEVAGLAFDRMGDAMMVTNAAGRILTINRAFTRITGYEAGEALGQHESKFRSGMQPAAFYDDMYAAVLRAGSWRGNTWCQRRDGTAYREWRSVSAVRDTEDRVTHYVTLFGELDSAGADRGVDTGAPERPARSA